MVMVVRCNNGVVTDEYLNIIGDTLSTLGQKVVYTKCVNDVFKETKDTIIVVARTVDAYKLIIHGYKRIIMWFQGVEPEESFMAHHSKTRFAILSHMEKTILKKSIFCFFVSKAMMTHYENKYGFKLCQNNYYVMPCLNSKMHPEVFQGKNKYKRNIFAYIGSMAIWQKFEDTVIAYKKVQNLSLTNAELWVFTNEKDKAEDVLKKYGIEKYKIDYVDNKELPEALSEVKYGFIIREDNIVNRVATPTKISTYITCGLIPIYSKCLSDFHSIAQDMEYVVCYDNEFDDKILQLDHMDIDRFSVLKEYEDVYSRYYDIEGHKERIKRLLELLVN